MTTPGATARTASTGAVAIPVSQTLPWLLAAVFVGLVLYYVVGVDEGAVSVFGDTTVVAEHVHDGRPRLGYPCH